MVCAVYAKQRWDVGAAGRAGGDRTSKSASIPSVSSESAMYGWQNADCIMKPAARRQPITICDGDSGATKTSIPEKRNFRNISFTSYQ